MGATAQAASLPEDEGEEPGAAEEPSRPAPPEVVVPALSSASEASLSLSASGPASTTARPDRRLEPPTSRIRLSASNQAQARNSGGRVSPDMSASTSWF